ncbi:MAG: hypothetical protein OXJ56_17500 [Rhodospirillaceae bacterium]|nr:hypothetical protein [Rhodospirillaceae bacterium]
MRKPLYDPSESERTNSLLSKFMTATNRHKGLDLASFGDLHRWSIDSLEEFWSSVWLECNVIGEPGKQILVGRDEMLGAQFFPDARLNFAENLLRRRDRGDCGLYCGRCIANFRSC